MNHSSLEKTEIYFICSVTENGMKLKNIAFRISYGINFFKMEENLV